MSYVSLFFQNNIGLEIKAWLKNNSDVDDFVIVDDEVFDSYDDFLLSKLIKISDSSGNGFGRGLLPKDVDKIVKQLGDNKNKNSCK